MQDLSNIFKYEKIMLFLQENYEHIFSLMDNSSNFKQLISIYKNNNLIYHDNIKIGFNGFFNSIFLLNCKDKNFLTYKEISLIVYKDLKNGINCCIKRDFDRYKNGVKSNNKRVIIQKRLFVHRRLCNPQI